ncbi:alpha/beta fold hydrolase [Sphingosinicella sp. BN140058]|uniref:alpha/beta fold hydrolase n=1 Tax=Sphingosinicella sp. BN140058 TaxID=1892855 RepID=UPI001012A20B|nr:alpha/beta hydrolase [Sphingosinicella sp. BN140058]QAY76514.1 alpha/beta hydrolase [Sphingosinicella sp. BN140058]
MSVPWIETLVMAALAASAAPAAQTADAGDRIDIGGRALRLSCRGSGGPTVIVDAGMGTAPAEDPGWQGIAEKIAPTARICLYDRAGLGGSDPAPGGPRTSADAAADLHAALAKAQVRGPYLLVGHSIGGLHAQVFAALYPEDVAGLVLVSSTHPDQMTTWLSKLPPPASGEEKAIAETRAFLAAMIEDPTRNEERLDFATSATQARRLTTLGAKPVIVATHSPRYRMVPGLSEPLAVTLEAETQRMQKQFLTLSSRAKQSIAETAGHGLPHEDPGFVVAAILEALALARADPPSS